MRKQQPKKEIRGNFGKISSNFNIYMYLYNL